MRPTRLLTALVLISACAAVALHQPHPKRQLIAVRDSPSIIDDTLKAEAQPSSNVGGHGKGVQQDEKVEARADGPASNGHVAPQLVRRLSVDTGSKDNVVHSARRNVKREMLDVWSDDGHLRMDNQLFASMRESNVSPKKKGSGPKRSAPGSKASTHTPALPSIPPRYLENVNWNLYNATSTTLRLDFALLSRKNRARLAYCADAVVAKSESVKSGNTNPNIVKRTGSETTTPTPAEIKAALDADVEATLALCPDLLTLSPKTGRQPKYISFSMPRYNTLRP